MYNLKSLQSVLLNYANRLNIKKAFETKEMKGLQQHYTFSQSPD